MLTLRRGTTDRGEAARRRGLRPSLAVSIAVNAAVVALFFQAVTHGLS